MESGELASFGSEEYLNRIKKIKTKMAIEGIEVLLCSDPSNMNFVTGYDGTSYYVHQLVLIILKSTLICSNGHIVLYQFVSLDSSIL